MSNEENKINSQNHIKLPTLTDKIRNKFRAIFGYKEGKKFIDDTKPYIRKYSEIELGIIANIEQKLKNVLAINDNKGTLTDGLNKEEAIKLLEWIVQRDRMILDKDNIKENSLLGLCGLSQGVVSTFLTNMGLEPRVSNINPTITGAGLGGHAFNSVALPIKDGNGKVHETNFLIDATYRQFFLRNEISISGRFVKDKRFGNKVSPMAGYWCINLPGGKEFANEILKNGFVELTAENAKIYGDSFILENEKDEEFRKRYKEGTTIPVSATKKIDTGISGEQYIAWFADKTRQDYRGIDYEENELEEYYGDLMKTPLMQKKEYQQKSYNNEQVQKEKMPMISSDIDKV